jgi:N-acetyl-gamma-glutamylphosphate reductase
MSKFAALGMAVDATSRIFLLHPVTRQPLIKEGTEEQAWIDVVSSVSQIGRAHDRSVTDKQIKMRGRRMQAEDIEADYTEKLAKLTRGWSLVTLAGEALDVEFTPGNARELYSLPELAWLRDQVSEFVADLGNFPTAASKN